MIIKSDYTQALRQMPNAHPLQSWTWGEFKSRWGWQMLPQAVYPLDKRNRVPLILWLALKRQVPRLPFSLLYVPKGPILDYEDTGSRQYALYQLEQLARREKAIFIKIDPDVTRGVGVEPEPVPSGVQFVNELQKRGWRFSANQIQFRNTVELDLTLPEEELLAAMKSKTRYNIRLAGRKGIVARPGTPDDFPVLAAMYQETAARDQFAIRPLAYYLDAWTSFYNDGMGQPFIAEYKGEPIAAVFIVRLGRKAIYMYGASTQKERNRMPNYLLQWEAIRWAKAQGCAVYDFWGAPDEFTEEDRMWGVWRFKRGFNGRVVHHIGAWDYVVRPFWYWLYTTAIPQYLNLLRKK